MREPEAAPLLEPIPEEERFATWRLVLWNGELVGDGTGGIDLLRMMRLTRPIARILGLVPRPALDAGSRLVARRRNALGQLVPDRPGPRRYP
jgi:hypothetical protein